MFILKKFYMHSKKGHLIRIIKSKFPQKKGYDGAPKLEWPRFFPPRYMTSPPLYIYVTCSRLEQKLSKISKLKTQNTLSP
jgi:hypothetical protein